MSILPHAKWKLYEYQPAKIITNRQEWTIRHNLKMSPALDWLLEDGKVSGTRENLGSQIL